MPFLSGVDFLRNLNNAPKVIFTTVYENFALQGFELDALDYLLRPISFDRFLQASNLAFDYFNTQVQSEKYLFVKSDKRLEKIMINDIIFIEAVQNHISIQTVNRKLLVHSTLKAIQEKLLSVFK